MKQTDKKREDIMNALCKIVGCKNYVRAFCHCCNQDLCRFHLNEHDDQLQNQIHPLADELNVLQDHFHSLNIEDFLVDFQEYLAVWKYDEHEKINRIAETKYNEFRNSIVETLKRENEKTVSLVQSIRKMSETQATTIEELRLISNSIEQIKNDLNQLEKKCKNVDFETILSEFDENGRSEKVFDLNSLANTTNGIERASDSCKAIAANDRFLLIQQNNYLCLLNNDLTIAKQMRWTDKWIRDICWSSTVSKFFLITLNTIFMLNDSDMSLETVKTDEALTYSSCTCSRSSLYVTTNDLPSIILEFDLKSNLRLINRWRPADLCSKDEKIQDIVYHRGRLAFIIENRTYHTKRMELRKAQDFVQIWSIQFDQVDMLNDVYRLSILNNNEWLVIDWKTSQILHISKDGQIKSTSTYNPTPYRVCQFGLNRLVVSTKTSLNFHQF